MLSPLLQLRLLAACSWATNTTTTTADNNNNTNNSNDKQQPHLSTKQGIESNK
jgi:hypothetical protein